jgi:hypothetical protein
MTPEDFQEANALDPLASPNFQDPVRPQDPQKVQAPPGYGGIDLNLISPELRSKSVADWFASSASNRAIESTMREAMKYNYEEYNEAKKHADALGMTVDEAINDKELARRLYREKSIRDAQFEVSAPALASLLKERDSAILAQDAINNFSYMERTWLAWAQGQMTTRRGELGMKMMSNTFSNEERAELEQLDADMAMMPPASGEILPEAARVFGLQAAMAPESVGTGLAVGGLAAVAAGLGSFGAGAGPAFATGYFWGSAGGSAYKMYEVEAGNAYADMIELGVQPAIAAEESKFAGAISSAIEFGLSWVGGAGFRRAVNSRLIRKMYGDEAGDLTAKSLLLGKGRMSRWVQAGQDYSLAVLTEPSEEWLQTVVQEYATKAAIAASSPEFRAKMQGMGNEEMESQAADAFVNTFWGMIVGGLSQGYAGYSSVVRKAQQAQKEGEILQELVDQAVAAPADPTVTKKMVTRLSDKYGNGDLSVSAEDILSVLTKMAKKVEGDTGSKFTTDDMINTLKNTDKDMWQALTDAIKTGNNAEILIKTPDFISKFVDRSTSPFYREIIQHLRVIKGEDTIPLSLAESKKLLASVEELQRRNLEIYEKEEKPFQEAATNVRKQLEEMFSKNTNLPESHRNVAVELVMARVMVNARRDRAMPTLEMAGKQFSVGQVGAAGITEGQFNALASATDALNASASDIDARYLAALKSGNVDAAQSIVDETANNAGFTEEGSHGLAYGDLLDNSFDPEALGSNTGAASAKLGFFFASKETAGNYGEKTVNASKSEKLNKIAMSILEPLIKLIPKGAIGSLDYTSKVGNVTDPNDVDNPMWFMDTLHAEMESIIDNAEKFASRPSMRNSDKTKILEAVAVAKSRFESELKQLPHDYVVDRAVIDVKLNMKNPFVFDYEGKKKRTTTYAEIIQKAKDAGHDGVIIKNTYDNGPLDDIKIVFSPNQIKQRDAIVRDNEGNIILPSQRFSLTNADVRFAQAPASGNLSVTAAYVLSLNRIILKKDATLREVIHEVGHMLFEDILFRATAATRAAFAGDQYNFQDIEIANEITSWMGLTKGNNVFTFESFYDLPKLEQERLHEMLAYNYERYMQDGKAPTKKLQPLFRKMGEILRSFWRNLKNDPATIYKQIYKQDLPILSSPAARALDLAIALEDQIESHEINQDVSLASMSLDDALSIGMTKDEWDEIQAMKREAVSEGVDRAIVAQFGNATWYARAIRAQNEKYERFVNAERRRIYEQQKEELRKLGIHNVRGWLLDGTAYDSDGNEVNLWEDIGNRINAQDVREAHTKLAEGMAYEIAQVQARIKGLMADEKANAKEIAALKEYISIAKSVVKIGTTPILASANRIFVLGRNSLATSTKSIEQFKSELLQAMTTTALRTVRRSPLYVYRDIRALVRAANEAKLSIKDVEEAIYQILVSGRQLNEFKISASMVVGVARKSEKQIKVGYARTANDVITALRIAYVKEALADAKDLAQERLEKKIAETEEKLYGLEKQYGELPSPKRNNKILNAEIKKAEAELAKLRTEYQRYIAGKRNTLGENTIKEMGRIDAELDALFEELDAITPAEYEAKSSAVYAKIVAAQKQLDNLLTREAKGVLTKEMLTRIEQDVIEEVAVNYPEMAAKLKDSDVRTGVMEAVNRRVASHIRKKFFGDMASDNGISIEEHRKRLPGKTKDAQGFVLAVIQAKQRGNTEEDVARERAEARLNDEFGKVATRMHVEAGAKELIAQAVEEEGVSEAYSDIIADDGVPLDLIRDAFGFPDNDALLFELLTSPSLEDVALENMEGIVARTPQLSDKKVRDALIADSVNNDMRVDIVKTEMNAAQRAARRVYDATLKPEERARREAEREALLKVIEKKRELRDFTVGRRDAAEAIGDTNQVDRLDEQIKSQNNEIRKLSVKANAPLVTAQEVTAGANHAAKVRMNRTLVGKVKSSIFLTAARRAERAALAALKKGSNKKDIESYMYAIESYMYAYVDAKVEQLLYEQLHREALAAERKMKSDIDFISTIFGDKHDVAKERNYDYVLASRAIAILFGLRTGNLDEAITAVDKIKEYDPGLHEHLIKVVRVSMFEASEASLNAMRERVVRAREDLVNEAKLPPIYKDLTWLQYSHLMTNIRSLWDIGKAYNDAKKASEATILQAQRDGAFNVIMARQAEWREARAKLRKIPIVGWFVPKESDLAKDPSRNSKVSSQYFSRMMKVESFFRELDGDKAGFFTNTIWRPISNAADQLNLRAAAFYDRYLRILAPFKDAFSAVREIKADELTDKDGKPYIFGENGGRGLSELFWTLLHIGNAGNYRRMIVGSGWGHINEDGTLDDSKWVAFYERAKRDGLIADEMLAAAQAIWDMFEELRPEYKRAYRKAKGLAFTDVEASEVRGVKQNFRGGYVPAEVDPKVRERFTTEADMDRALAQLRDEVAGNSAPFIPDGRGRDRNENYEKFAKTLRTDHMFVPKAFEQMLRFIVLHDPLKNAIDILKDGRVSGALNEYHWGVMSDAIIPWITDIATRSSSKQNDETARVLAAIRTAQVGSQMFLNVKVSAENIFGWVPAMAEVPRKYIFQAIKQVSTKPMDVKKEISDMSPAMAIHHKQAMLELATDIRDFLEKGGKLSKLQDWYKENATLLVKQTQAVASDIVWIAKFNQVMTESNITDPNERRAEAIQEADSAVRLTQNSYRIEDKTVLERGSEMAKMIATYTGWFNMIRQLFTRKSKRALLEGTLGAATAQTGFYFLTTFMVPSMVSAALVYVLYDGLGDDDEEKRDEFINELLWMSTLRTVASGFPVVGQIGANVLDRMAGKSYGKGFGENPVIGGVGRQLTALGKLVTMPVSDKDWTGRDTKAIADGISAILGVPSVGRQLGYLQAVATDEEQPQGIIDFVRGVVTGVYK